MCPPQQSNDLWVASESIVAVVLYIITCMLYTTGQSVAVPGSLHEGCAPSLGLVIDRGVTIYQQSHNLIVTFPTGQSEGRVIIAARGHVNLSTRVQQELCGFQMAFPGGVCRGSDEQECKCNESMHNTPTELWTNSAY